MSKSFCGTRLTNPIHLARRVCTFRAPHAKVPVCPSVAFSPILGGGYNLGHAQRLRARAGKVRAGSTPTSNHLGRRAPLLQLSCARPLREFQCRIRAVTEASAPALSRGLRLLPLGGRSGRRDGRWASRPCPAAMVEGRTIELLRRQTSTSGNDRTR